MTVDRGDGARVDAFVPDGSGVSPRGTENVADQALIEARNALRTARSLPLVDQPAALEAVHAALSARLGDVQNA